MSFIFLSLATTLTRSSWTKSRSRLSVQSGAHQKTTMWVQSNNVFWIWLIVAVVADFCLFCKVFLTFFFTKKAFFQGTPYLYGYNFLWGKLCFPFFQSMSYSTLVWRFPNISFKQYFLDLGALRISKANMLSNFAFKMHSLARKRGRPCTPWLAAAVTTPIRRGSTSSLTASMGSGSR